MIQRLTNKDLLVCLLCLFAMGSCMNPIQYGDSLTITTSSGISQGTLHKNVITWEDIPYAIPPEGNLRWKAPRPKVSPELIILPQEGNGCLQEASIYAGIEGEGIMKISPAPQKKI